MSCKYCENYGKKPDDWKTGEIILIESQMFTHVGDGKPYFVPMNYCQNCGAELRREPIYVET